MLIAVSTDARRGAASAARSAAELQTEAERTRRRACSDGVQGLLKPVGVRALCLRERFEPVGDLSETFLARGLRHSRVHVGVLVGLAGNRCLQVQACLTNRKTGGRVTYRLEIFEMAVRVTSLAF